MNEAATITVAGPEVSARLTRETGIMAGRLADLLATSLPQGDGSMNEGRQFLQAFHDSVTAGRTTSFSSNLTDSSEPVLHPLDRLTRSLQLSDPEIELLLLSGMSEEHEGLASILRSLHPRNEPYASVGLAAQMLSNGQANRSDFRALIESSRVVRSGAVGITDDGPFFERSLRLGRAVWSALHGIDVWPAEVETFRGSVATVGLEEWFETPAAERAIRAVQQPAHCTILITADNEEIAFGRGLAVMSYAGAESVGILLPASRDAALERLIEIHALARGIVPVFKVATSERPMIQPPMFTSFAGPIVACSQASGNWIDEHRRLLG